MTCRLEDILQAPAEEHSNIAKEHNREVGELGNLPGSLFLCPNLSERTDARMRKAKEELVMGELSGASDEELLSYWLPAATVQEIAAEYGTCGHLRQWLVNTQPKEMAAIRGIGPKKAKQIQALYELMLRCQGLSKAKVEPGIRSPKDVFRCFRHLSYRTQEEFHIVLLNTKHRVLSSSQVVTGVLDGALIAPREVFARAIKQAAAAVVLVHNHPSGDTTPSKEDKVLTARMVEAGKIIGIDVLDHIIVGHLGYSSASEDGWL